MQKKGKYVVVDFLGSWCGPCINALPELVSLNKKYPKKDVNFISIAYDEFKDLNKLKDLIKEHNLNWENIIEDRKTSGISVKDYLVQAFPTTLLIDPKGKVIVRGISASVFAEIDAYLAKNLK